MQQLTAEDKFRIFCQYPLCTYTYMADGERLYETVDGKTLKFMYENIHRDNPQLILRHISKISDEDKLLWYDTVGVYEEKTISRSPNPSLMSANIKIEMASYFLCEVELSRIPYHTADFLRSRSYALPYRVIDLFEAGIAIEQP